jgi:dTDP-4-amino-4,6-dideoxygalactose transaminase
MTIPFVDLHAQYQGIKSEIDAAIAEVIRESGFVRSRFVDEFEGRWAETIGVRHCVSCANGTDALFIAMRGLGIKAGDEVITTAHSWIATSETITLAGGRVVFCDTEADSFNIDASQIEGKITARTVGIIPVHMCGQPADMETVMAVARRRGLWVIEDCAQSHLARFQDRLVGTFGNAATFSFYPGKNLGAMGDAGCMVTNDGALANWCALFARHGGKSDHVMEGINSRLDGLQAAILSAKLPHLRSWTEKRRKVAAAYDHQLKELGVLTPVVGAEREHVYHLYMIRAADRAGLRKHLADRGVATVINYPKALPFYPAYSYLGHRPEDFPRAHENQSRILSLPIFPELSDAQQAHVIGAVASFVRGS